jgi:spermidine/putrescine ABC transporter ATP-binding subunit
LTVTPPTKDAVDVRLDSIFKSFDGTAVVDGVSMAVFQGEFLSLLGPSGCGKSTTLRIIAGLEDCDAGIVYIGDRKVNDLAPHRRNVGMVFQSYALFPHMTVYENIAFGLRMRGVGAGEIKERVSAAMDLVRLEGLAGRYSSQLSGGQRQRVALARALAPSPAVLLLDEPLAALDKRLREQVQVELKQLQRKVGITTIFVTHDQAEALTLSDRIAVMSAGKIQQIGSPEDLYEHPANDFVANFLGETNFIPGRLVSIEGPSCTVRIGDAIDVIATTSAEAIAVGDAVKLAVRPEHLQLADPDPTAEGHPGTVVRVVYGGSTLAVEFEIARDVTLMARVRSDDGRGRWRPREPVQASWRWQLARVYRQLPA